MVFIWRGAGILVPIIFLISGWIVSYWFEDTRLGNPVFMGWTAFYAGIFNFVTGLGLMGMSDDNDNHNIEPGEVPVKKKHDFFWIPVIVWGLLFGGWSAYLLIGGESQPKTSDIEYYDNEDDENDAFGTKRVINYYNPTEDSMSYFIQDRADFLESEYVGPLSFESKKYSEDTYLIAGFDHMDEIQLSLSDEDFVEDEDKYTIVEVENDDGTTSRVYHRIVNPETRDKNDYDESWIVLTGTHDLILVDVSMTCSDTITKGTIWDMNWMNNVEERYDGRDMIEPLYKKDPKGKTFTVMGPGERIPVKIGKKEIVYALIPIPHDQELTREYLRDKIIEVTF